METERLHFLDLFKFVAAICIACMLHYHDHLLPSYSLEFPFADHKFFCYWTTHGWIFVEMFFMISGLLFYQVYLPKIKSENYKFKDFFCARAIRLYPLVIITSLYMYLWQFILEKNTGMVWSSAGTLKLWTLFEDIIFCGSMYDGSLNAPLWYLNVLLVCYVLAYIMTKLTEKYDRGGYLYIQFLLFGV